MTASTTGPMNRPITPKAIRPPITPAMMRTMGRSAPRRMSSGRMTLSSTATTTDQTRRTVAQTVCPLQYSQATAGKSTRPGPIWAMHSKSITAISSAAAGTPATIRPNPPRADWMIAVPTTPRATLRMAMAESLAASRPRSPASRVANPHTRCAAFSPLA